MVTVIKDALTYATASFFTITAMTLDASAATLNPSMGDSTGTYVKIAAIVMAVAFIVIVAVLIVTAKKKNK